MRQAVEAGTGESAETHVPASLVYAGPNDKKHCYRGDGGQPRLSSDHHTHAVKHLYPHSHTLYVYTHTSYILYMHTHARAYTHMRAYTCTHICAHAHAYTHMRVYTYTHELLRGEIHKWMDLTSCCNYLHQMWRSKFRPLREFHRLKQTSKPFSGEIYARDPDLFNTGSSAI